MIVASARSGPDSIDSAIGAIIVLKQAPSYALRKEDRGSLDDEVRWLLHTTRRECSGFIYGHEKELVRKYGDFGGYVCVALAEAITNYQFHANKDDPKKLIAVKTWRDSRRLYYTIGGQGDAWDPHTVRIDPLNEDGTVYMGRDRRIAGRVSRGGRGNMLMAALSSYLAYDADGRGMYIAFDLPKEYWSEKEAT